MKKVVLILLIFCVGNLYSQDKAIPNFGKTFLIENPDLTLETDKKYKVIFDVFKDVADTKKRNRSIETVARFINMHTQQGVPLENLDIVLVLHGAAVKNTIKETVFKKQFEHSNPNLELLSALKKANVKVYVCGQSVKARGYNTTDVYKDVNVSLSALTALVHYQTLGYQQINFN